MKITKRQLRRIIREAIDQPPSYPRTTPGLGDPSPDVWADQNGLGFEFDNEGQKIIYLDNEQAARLNLPPGVSWDVEQLADGWVIYTGEYEGGWDEHPEQEQARREIEDEEAYAAGRPWEHN